jgi:hypothetical protein
MTQNDFTSLTERERQVTFDVARYCLITTETLRRLRFPDLSEDAVRKLLGRMTEAGSLVRHLLRGQEPYFVLGQPALSALGLRRSTKPLGHQALLEHYAILIACARRGCDVISEEEFREDFPLLCEPGLTAKNFFTDDTTDPPRLGWFVVDHDKLTARLVAKVRGKVAKILDTRLPAFHELVFYGRLAFHVITATEGKRASLEAAFARKQRKLGVDVVVEAYPDHLADFFLVKRR